MRAPLTLRDYQTPAVKWLYDRLYGALLGDLGTGKTIIVLALLEVLRVTEGGRTLLIAPKKVKDLVWEKEARQISTFDSLKISSAFAPGAHVHLVNPESLHKVPNWADYTNLIIDESTDFKSASSRRFAGVAARRHLFKRRYILTAGPQPNSIEDLWAQYFILDGGVRLGPNITAFRDTYMQRTFEGHGYEPVPGAVDEINRRIADCSYRIDRDEVLTLPELRETNIMIDLPGDIQRVYRKLERDLVGELEKEKIVALSAVEAYAKCRQFTGGFLYSWPEDIPRKQRKPIHQSTHWIHDYKLAALGRLHADLNWRPLLVVYEFEAEGKAIEGRFRCPRISGKTKGSISRLVDRWNRGEIPMLCAQIRPVARGLNLQFGGRDLCVYSLPNRADDYFQVVGRLHRSGQEKDVNVYRMVCRGTVDQFKLQPRLDKKISAQKATLKALKDYYVTG